MLAKKKTLVKGGQKGKEKQDVGGDKKWSVKERRDAGNFTIKGNDGGDKEHGRNTRRNKDVQPRENVGKALSFEKSGEEKETHLL